MAAGSFVAKATMKRSNAITALRSAATQLRWARAAAAEAGL